MLSLGVHPSRSTTVYISRALTQFQNPDVAFSVFHESLNYFISAPRYSYHHYRYHHKLYHYLENSQPKISSALYLI